MTITSPVASAASSQFRSSPQFDRPTYLMCTPQWYDIDYVINPWMAGNLHRPTRDKAFSQWRNLHQKLRAQLDRAGVHRALRENGGVISDPAVTFNADRR